MRNTTQRAIVILVLCVAGGLLLNVVPVHGDETLMVTKDQFEFRDSPRVDEDTLIGTLRAGTQVEWTGTVSGDWFEVHGPGNQVGWIHKSGVSAPKSAPISQQQPAPTPARASSSRAATAPSTSALQERVTKLEKDNALYEALLNEKELRVTELSKEIEELEQKLLDTAQGMSDSQQMREMQQAQVTEFEKRLAELNTTLEQKESELRKTNIELTKLQTQLNRARPTDSLFLYGISGILGLLVFLLLSAVWWYVRRNASAGKVIAPQPDRRPEHIHPGTSERPGITKEPGETDVPASPPAPASPPSSLNEYIDNDVEDLEEIEDVEIELSDVLPTTDLDSPAPGDEIEEVGDINIVSESDLNISKDLDVLEEIEAIEDDGVIEDDDVIEEVEIIEDVDSIEDIATVEEIDVIEEIDVLDEIDEIDAIDEITDADDVEVPDAPDEIGTVQSGALENVALHVSDDMSFYEDLEEREEHLDVFDEEEPGTDSDFDFDSIYEYEADTVGDAEEAAEKAEPVSEPVDIGGETYEMLVEQSTQIIETDDDLEDEVLMAPKAFEDAPDLESEYLPTLREEIEDLSDLLEAREIELEEIHEYNNSDENDVVEEVVDEELDYLMADLDEEHVQDVEIEDIEVIEDIEDIEDIDELDDFDDIEVIEDIDDVAFEADGESEFESVTTEHPDLLEPSPVLIEPEYEPADVMLSASAKNNAATASDVNADKTPIYEIELVHVGTNTEQIIEFLSKVKGLPKPPEELVRSVPMIITRDAKETDAKNFQILMQKLGATIRVVKH